MTLILLEYPSFMWLHSWFNCLPSNTSYRRSFLKTLNRLAFLALGLVQERLCGGWILPRLEVLLNAAPHQSLIHWRTIYQCYEREMLGFSVS